MKEFSVNESIPIIDMWAPIVPAHAVRERGVSAWAEAGRVGERLSEVAVKARGDGEMAVEKPCEVAGFGADKSSSVAGEVLLKKGTKREHFRLRLIPDEEKPEVLKTYLSGFRTNAV